MPDELTIVPFSGIQILDFELDLRKVKSPFKRFAIKTALDETGREIKQLFPLFEEQAKDEELVKQFGDIFREPYEQIVSDFEGVWLPAPIFKLAGREDGEDTFDSGPSTWARMRIKVKERSEQGIAQIVICQIALDTQVDLENKDTLSSDLHYLMPSRTDVLEEKEFRFVSSLREMAWFLETDEEFGGQVVDTQEWVSQWISDALEEKVQRSHRNRNRYWAKYLTLVEIFGNAEIPKLKLIDTISDSAKHIAVPTDFVVDLGNSRTCGIFLEKHERDTVEIKSAIHFKIRDFTNAELYNSGLIESSIELSQANFGREDLARRSGRKEAFVWPSPVRIGKEAVGIKSRTKGSQLKSGLSSAKRYLWDLEPVARDWRFAEYGLNSDPLIATKCKELLTNSGDFRRDGDERSRDLRFSRSSFVMFMIAELIAHAFVQINNPQERSNRPESGLPRRLAKIILTIPTATPSFEQAILKRRAKDALDFVWKVLGIPEGDGVFQKPELIVRWDEASCSQQVYLYNEIIENLSGNIPLYFETFGKKRKVNGLTQNTLKVATVDIGGGTTDVMVTTYYSEAGTVIHPIQEFREGFRVAGDDILSAIINSILIPEIEGFLKNNNAPYAERAISQFFKSSANADLNQLKSTFAYSVLAPLAVKVMEGFEQENIEVVQVKIDQNLTHGECGFTEPFDCIAKDAGLEIWPNVDLNIFVSYDQLNTCVVDVLGRVSENISVALQNFNCDVVLLTGRPSKLPMVYKLFEKEFVVPSHRLVSLHSYRVGSWYPFRDAQSGKIGDPKSTVVVGALLNSVSVTDLPNYSFRSDELTLKSSVNFIGPMEISGKIFKEKVVVNNLADRNQEEFQYLFYNVVYLGGRQIDDEDWVASPLYKLKLTSKSIPNLPLKVTLFRNSEAFEEDESWNGIDKEYLKELLKITEIEDSEGNLINAERLQLSFNTLGRIENYWMETGIFE